MRRKAFLFWGGNIFIPLLIGAVLYLVYSPDVYVAKLFYKIANLQTEPGAFATKVWAGFPLRILRYYLCDMLWAYALTFTCSAILGQRPSQLVFSIVICFLFELSIEWGQRLNIIPGTFDWLDVFLEFASTLVAMSIIKHNKT